MNLVQVPPVFHSKVLCASRWCTQFRNTRPTLKAPGRDSHRYSSSRRSGATSTRWVESARKLRLLPMSFLLLKTFRTSSWLFLGPNVEQTHPLIQEIFAPLLEQYGKYIEIKRFDAAAEIKKVCSHYRSNTQSFSNLTEELVKIYESQELVDSQSDLMRLLSAVQLWRRLDG